MVQKNNEYTKRIAVDNTRNISQPVEAPIDVLTFASKNRVADALFLEGSWIQ